MLVLVLVLVQPTVLSPAPAVPPVTVAALSIAALPVRARELMVRTSTVNAGTRRKRHTFVALTECHKHVPFFRTRIYSWSRN